MAENESAGYWGWAVSLRESDSTRMKLGAVNRTTIRHVKKTFTADRHVLFIAVGTDRGVYGESNCGLCGHVNAGGNNLQAGL